MTRVIVIEDDHDGAEVLSECLRIKGIDVLEKGYNGLEAVQLYKKLKPDFVLLDMLMPFYDGFYGLRKILEFDPKAKVIVVSASIAADEKEKLTNLGASAIVSKPYEIDALVGALDTLTKEQENNLKSRPIII
jgi:two-component system, chemotaxis family, chemotaxis protein CheY